VFLPRDLFDHPMLRDVTAVNPIAALMDIMRQPLLDGVDPDLRQYGLALTWAAGFWAVALFLLRRNERKIVFYY
jgi:ABC-type polysaccharide/polyol phosphate export permease